MHMVTAQHPPSATWKELPLSSPPPHPPVLCGGNAKWVGVVGDMAAKAVTLTDELCGWYWASINICPALEWQVISSLIRFEHQCWLWLLVHTSPSLTVHAIIAFDGFSRVLVFSFTSAWMPCAIHHQWNRLCMCIPNICISGSKRKWKYNIVRTYF